MFLSFLAPDLVDRIRRWDELKRWERKEIGQTLRRMGLTYREIAAVIPVCKATLSVWCRELEVPQTFSERRDGLATAGRSLKKRRHVAWDRATVIRGEARQEVASLVGRSSWVAGAVAYWAEGTKRGNELAMSNSDPAMLRLFIGWCEIHLDVSRDRFTVRLHIHSGQDEREIAAYWSEQLGLPPDQFRKSYIKPEGTGHRKNNLYMGTAQVRVRRSTALRHKVLGWIDGLSDAYGNNR
jgi:hypothetical protein